MKPLIKKSGIILITVLLLYLAFRNVDIKELIRYIKHFKPLYLILLPISIVTALTFRGLCFKQLIQKSVKISLKDSALLCLTASAFNILVPARAGDFFRAYFVGKKYEVSKVKIFGAIMFERILDMIAICSYLAFGIFVYNKNELAMKLCIYSFVFIILGIVFALFTYKFLDIEKICDKASEKTQNLFCGKFLKDVIGFFKRIFSAFCSGFEILDSPKKLFFAVLTSFSIWFFECLNYFIVLKGFDSDIHWSATIFISCFIVFAGFIPSASIFLGPAQIAVITAFALYNAGKETALAVSVTEQSVCTLISVLVAVYFLRKNNISYADIKKDMK